MTLICKLNEQTSLDKESIFHEALSEAGFTHVERRSRLHGGGEEEQEEDGRGQAAARGRHGLVGRRRRD